MKHIDHFRNFSLNETSKYKSPFGIPFIKLFTKICNHYPIENYEITADFKNVLFQYVSADQSKKFPINFYSKEFNNLMDLIHELDHKNAEILLHRLSKKKTNLSLPDLNTVWSDKKNKIYVYRANTAFESIALGEGTNFCISSDYRNGRNLFYDYIYDSEYNKKASIYFIKSPNQSPFFTTIAIDVKESGGYLYTDVRNKDKNYESFDEMIEDEYTSPDLKLVPEKIFKPFEHSLTKEEFLAFPFLIGLTSQKLNEKEVSSILNNRPLKYDSLILSTYYPTQTQRFTMSHFENKWINQMSIKKYFGGYISVLNMKNSKCGLFFNTIEELIDYTNLNFIIFIKKKILMKNNGELNQDLVKYLDKNKHLFTSKWVKLIKEDELNLA